MTKQGPATGTTGLGSPVTLQWSALPEEGYYVCWDTTDNNTCDTTWWPNAAATTRAVSGLAVGTYYWQVKTIGGLEADGGTWWSFTVTVPFVPPDHWKAEYFGNATLSGAPVATVDEGTGFVDHSWGTGGPAGLADQFSARFTRTVTLAAGTYRFTAVTDDGNQLWVDDQLQITAWGADGLTTHTVDLDLAAGDHTLRFQYVEHTGGATAQLTWALRTPVVLASGESLGENQTRVSLDGAYRLQYQGDGNLVVVRLADDTCAWSSQTNNTSVGATVMQGDGNLVVYDGDWIPVWNAGTAGHDGARLEIANDTMAIVAPDATTLWSVSLAAAAPNAWSSATTGTLPGASRGPAGRAAGVLLGVIALIGFVASVVRRRRFESEPQVRRGLSGSGGRAASRVLARFSATALLLTAMLVVPASALAQIPTQVIEYYSADALGSVRAVTKQVNGTWQVVARHDFMPFGEEVAPPTPPQDKRLFTGKERDNETGLDYFGARYSSSRLGRFTTTDPLLQTYRPANPQTLNRYAYTLNNPLRFVDRNGLYEEDVHRYLTEVLAMAVGFDATNAAAIARADQGVDDNPSTSASAGYDARRDYHFTTAERRDVMWAAFEASGATADLGSYLHAEQDSYSHAGYGPRTGHATALTAPDKTYNDSDKAGRMAKDSYDRLSMAAERLGVSGSKLPWAKIDALVGDFNRARTGAEKNKILGQLRTIISGAQERQVNQKKKDEELSR